MTNTQYWTRKLVGNVSRDKANQAKLKQMGWKVVLVWQCNLQKDTEELIAHLVRMKRVFDKSAPIPENCADTPRA